MKAIKNFDEFLEKGIVKKQSPDKSRVNSLIKESEQNYLFLSEIIKKLGITNNNANNIIKICYDTLMEITRAKMLMDGYNASGYGAHEAEVSYLRVLKFNENEVQFANQIRSFRNGILYSGEILDDEYAENVLDFTNKVYLKLKKDFTNLPVSRSQAIYLLNSFPQKESDMNHYLESEAIMKGLAKEFGEDKDYWGMLGLLHDVDWAKTRNNVEEHLTKTFDILKEKGFDEEFINTIISHGYGAEQLPELKNKKRTKKIEYALAAAETITGIIYAYALMRGRKISDMKVKGLKKKFKDKKFAQNCNREIVKEIEETGLTLDKFFEIAINSIKNIREKIELE